MSLYFKEDEEMAIFGLIPDCNVMVQHYFESGLATQSQKAQLERGNAVQRSRAVGDLLTSAVGALRHATGLPELFTTLVWIGQTEPMVFIRLRSTKSPSAERLQSIEKLRSLIGVTEDLDWYYSYQHPRPACFKGFRPPREISARRLQDKFLDELLARYPLDPNYRIVTFEEQRLVRHQKSLAEIDEKLAKLRAPKSERREALLARREHLQNMVQRVQRRIEKESLLSGQSLTQMSIAS
ncbi:hypothetical protein C8J56DRAFT_962554 [Mycena floridula]|nr:hypothetical protein C8J56DRAFT_962554 [Mycena floridula]